MEVHGRCIHAAFIGATREIFACLEANNALEKGSSRSSEETYPPSAEKVTV